MPGAVAVIKGAPHPGKCAQTLRRHRQSKEGEAALIAGMPGVFSLRGLSDKKNWENGGEDFSFLNNAPLDDYTQWTASWGANPRPVAADVPAVGKNENGDLRERSGDGQEN